MKSINRNVWIILGVVGVAMASPLWFRQLQRLQVRRAPSAAVSSARLAAVDMTPANSGRSRPTPVSLALSGDLDMPASGATSVVVRVGAQQFPAVVSGDAFSANLPQVLQGANISIEATRGNLVYRALIGSAGLAKRQAGVDGRLDASENPSLHVSPLSTAYHFFITRELGDRLPANDDEMDRALRSVYAPDIPVAANALDKIAKGTVVVPQLYANGLALIGDRQAFRRFLYDNAAAIGDPMTYLRQQPGNTFSLADLQKTWVLTGQIGRAHV